MDIGQENYNKLYPILIDFGDLILFEENRPKLEKKLQGILAPDKIRQYYNVFTLVVF